MPEQKLVGYLLSESHPIGRWKARFFARLGYPAREASRLREALLRLAVASEVSETVLTPHGTKYMVDGYIEGISKSPVRLRTVWMVKGEGDSPRFVTAYPL